MRLFKQHKFYGLEDALNSPTQCEFLDLTVDFNLKDKGLDFSKLTNLKELYIKGDCKIYDAEDFELPVEIGQLKRLRILSILNLPIKEFPTWTFNLTELRFLMLRGTDLTSIPTSILQLRNLETLKIENCSLTKLPIELSKMNKMRHLGFCDTRLSYISEELFPKKLKTLDFSGTGCYDLRDLEKLRTVMTKTKISPKQNQPLTLCSRIFGLHGLD